MKRKFLFMLVLSLLVLTGTKVLAQDEFVFGVVMVGPHDDGGWSQAHLEGGKYVETHMPGAKMLTFDKLNPADSPETTLSAVVGEMVSSGAKLIFTTSDDFIADTDTVALQFPDVVFISVTGNHALEGIAPPNVGNFDGMNEITEGVAGCASALASQTGSIGYVGPLINYESRRLAASAFLGARHCWEKYRGKDATTLEFVITWIGFWFNIPGVTLDPTQEAGTLFANGSDVVFSALDTPEAVTVAGQRRAEGANVYGMGYDNPAACDVAPEACLGAPYYNWGPQYLKTALAVRDGTWTQSWEWIPPNYENLNDRDTSIVGFARGPGMSPEVGAQLDLYMAELRDFGMDPANKDKIFLWQGPLKLQDGTVLAEAGESVRMVGKEEDGDSVWYLPQLLEGMKGASS